MKGGGKGKSGGKSQGFAKGSSGKGWTQGPGKGGGGQPPPRDGYLICWGPHWARDCPQRTYSLGVGGASQGQESWSGGWDANANLAPTSKLCGIQTVEPGDDAGWTAVPRGRCCGGACRGQRTGTATTGTSGAKFFPMEMGDEEQREKRTERLSLLATVNPEGVQSVQDSEWELVEAAVDSGATENAIADRMLKSVETTEGEASRRGVAYEVADGKRIPNLGEKRFVGFTAEGIEKGLVCQVCDVNRPLLSVSKIVNAGHTVTFSPSGSWIQDNETGQTMALREDAGMYTIQMWVRNRQAPFGRPSMT